MIKLTSQLSLFLGPLPNHDECLRKGTAQDRDDDYEEAFVQAPAPARRKRPVCLEESCEEVGSSPQSSTPR